MIVIVHCKAVVHKSYIAGNGLTGGALKTNHETFFTMMLIADGNQKAFAGIRAITGEYINVLGVEAKGAMIAAGSLGNWNGLSAMLAEEGIVDLLKASVIRHNDIRSPLIFARSYR